MSTTAGRVFTAMTRAAFSRGVFNHNSTTTVRLNSVRCLALSSQVSARSKDDEEEVNNEPIKFSTSKASHRTWKVDRSMGSQYERPWWKVLPVTVMITGILLWCVLREETDIDAQLFNLPATLSEEEQVQKKSN